MINLRGSTPLPPGKYTSAIFFDNDADKIENVDEICPSITGHLIPETEYPYPPTKFTDEPLKSVIQAAGSHRNTYVKYLNASNINEDYYDQLSGFDSDVHGPLLNSWLDGLEVPEDAIVLFDWDRTITKFEGFYYPPIFRELSQNPRARHFLRGVTEELFIEDALRYLLGGDERLTAFRDICQKIGERGVTIGILTNSGSCTTDYFKLFVDLLIPSEVDNLFILCSRPAPFRGNKGLKLKSIEHFSQLCPAFGGGYKRRRKTKRHLRLKRRSKRKSRKIQ